MIAVSTLFVVLKTSTPDSVFLDWTINIVCYQMDKQREQLEDHRRHVEQQKQVTESHKAEHNNSENTRYGFFFCK